MKDRPLDYFALWVKSVAKGMNADLMVKRLLEDDEDESPAQFLKNRLNNEWEQRPLQLKVSRIPGGMRRTGDGYEDQWDFIYKDWLFTVSTYEDGTQIWSAHYKTPAFSWDTKAEQKRGWTFSGGEVVKLPYGYDPATYLQRLKGMANKNPNVWKVRRVPSMPEP